MKSLIYIKNGRITWHAESEAKRGKTKTIKLRIWPALKAYNYTNTGKYTHINDNTWVFFCCCWSGAKDNAIVTLNEMCLTLKNSLTLYRAYRVETIKNFMRKKGSTQVTVRNKYLYEKKKKESSRRTGYSVGIFYFGRSPLFFSPSFSTLFGYYCPHLVLSTWFYYHFPCGYRRYCCYYCCCWSVVILKTNWI